MKTRCTSYMTFKNSIEQTDKGNNMSKISDELNNRSTVTDKSINLESFRTLTDELINKSAKQGKEVVEHPSHYNHGKYECIDIIDDLKLNFNLGSALKYIWRCGLKDDEVIELEKAKWYLEREIENRKHK